MPLHCFSLCVSNNVSTVPVNDTNHITFGSTLGKEHNPFSLNFTIPSVSTVFCLCCFRVHVCPFACMLLSGVLMCDACL